MCKEDHPCRGLRLAIPALALLAALAPLAEPGAASAAAAEAAPACSDCHDTTPTLQKSVHGQAGLECVSCHSDLAGVKEFPHPKPAQVDCTACHEVKVSQNHPPRCGDCHGSHAITKISGTTRTAAADRLSSTCGNCHEEIAGEYMEGIHGRELRKGNPDVPTCLTCHGGHAILLNADPDSPVSPRSLAHTCASCHDNEEIAARYHMPPQRLQTFVGTYHGLASEYGEKGVANCASCHDNHKILPSSDPQSSTSPRNLVATCGKCHPQAGRHFAIGKVHLRDRWEDNPFTYVAGFFYRTTISSMMVVFAIYMIVDFGYRLRKRREEKAREEAEKERHGAPS